MINPEIFREYDIRGVADSDLTSEVVASIGQAYGTYIQSFGSNKIIVGRDNRLSSERLRDNLVEGLTAAGCEVIDIGVVTTPMLYYSRAYLGIDGAVMITGSHNPGEFNGFKMGRGQGTIYGEEIQKLRLLIEEGTFAVGQGSVSAFNIWPAYLEMLTERIQLGPYKLKVVVDAGNGTAGLYVVQFLEAIGCEVIPLFCDSDGCFPNHHPDPVKAENLKCLRDAVLSSKADLGVAYDGDADRIGAVDDQGNFIYGDLLMVLYWREILPKYPGTTAIVEVKCSQALVDEIVRLGGQPLIYKTGHSLIKAKMKEVGAVFTGEMSGHMFFADEFFGFDDAFYATGRLLRILSNNNKSMSELCADIPRYYATGETRVDCPDCEKFAVVEGIQKAFRENYDVIDIDGARVLFPDGWGLVRASNTQPVLVTRCEAKTPEKLEEIKSIIKESLLRFPQITDFSWE